MNHFDGLDIGSDTKDKLKDANESAVDRLFKIASGDENADEKMLKFKNAKKDNTKLFEDILGEKEFKKYKKSVRKRLKPYKRKAKLVGFLL